MMEATSKETMLRWKRMTAVCAVAVLLGQCQMMETKLRDLCK
jgi:hypothetical protein